jgi:hypothetical protein
MTAVVTPATDDLPEWEEYARQRGALPPVDTETATDVDYLVARLRRARERAAGYAAERRAASESSPISEWLADRDELVILRDKVDDLIGDLRPFGRAGTEMLEVLRALHPHMNWRVRAGGLFGTEGYTAEAHGAAERVAKHLRLTPRPATSLGRRWHGRIETWDIEVWARP